MPTSGKQFVFNDGLTLRHAQAKLSQRAWLRTTMFTTVAQTPYLKASQPVIASQLAL